MHKKFLITIIIFMVAVLTGAQVSAQGIVIDHTCTDITQIPAAWINQVKSQVNVHFAHTSHGSQIMTGLERLAGANATYGYYPQNCAIPVSTTHLSLMDGQLIGGSCDTYIYPEYYWQGAAALNITRGTLNANTTTNVSMWTWCTQLDTYSQAEAQAYLDAMAQLETEYPGITFVYMTGNAQSAENNRYQRNTQIRDYCRNNNKILFDFADLDSWYGGEQHTEGGIPMEHPHYNGDEAGHTTYESCENKARAFWWLLARISGWDGNPTGTDRARYDFNGDGHIDVLYRHPTNGKIGVWYMNGVTETSWAQVRDSSNDPANHGTDWDIKGVGDFNGDGYNDAVYRNSSGSVGVWLMNGVNETTWSYIGNHGTWEVKGVGDFNSDGNDDLLYRHPANGNIGVWYMTGVTESGWQYIGNHGTSWDIPAVGDFNNDSRDDILYRNPSGSVGVWYMNGVTETSWQYIGNHGASWDVPVAGDFNGDGHDDILYRHTGNGNVGVWYMNGAAETSWNYVNNHGSWEIR